MQPAPPARAGEPEETGMTEQGAAFAVLGVDVEAIGHAVARWWGLDDGVLTVIRPLPLGTPVRNPDGDDEMLRTLASCAHETMDALALPAPRVQAAVQRVAQRYGRALGITLRELQAALQGKPVGPISQPGNAGLTDLAPLDPLPAGAGTWRGAGAEPHR
jgi:non-specific serine/threonine protein kinase